MTVLNLFPDKAEGLEAYIAQERMNCAPDLNKDGYDGMMARLHTQVMLPLYLWRRGEMYHRENEANDYLAVILDFVAHVVADEVHVFAKAGGMSKRKVRKDFLRIVDGMTKDVLGRVDEKVEH